MSDVYLKTGQNEPMSGSRRKKKIREERDDERQLKEKRERRGVGEWVGKRDKRMT